MIARFDASGGLMDRCRSRSGVADVASIAIVQHRATLEAQVVNDQLNYALNGRFVIEQAKEMVAELEGRAVRTIDVDIALGSRARG